MALLLSADDVRLALPIGDAVDAIRDSFIQLAKGEVQMPLRIHMNVQPDDGDVLVMPSFIPKIGRVAVKVVNVFKSNEDVGLPFIQGMVLICSANTGTPLAIVEGGSLTAIRTGAATGVATDALARPDASTVAVFGAGVQARTQLSAVCAVRDIKHVQIIDYYLESAQTFAAEINEAGAMSAAVATTPAAALTGADIVCAATTSEKPIFDDADLEPGTHLNAIGSFRPSVQEICEETVLRSKIVCDHTEMALAETGDLIIPIEKGLMTADDIHGDLGDVLIDKIPGRENDEEITFFKSVGLAIQDLAAGVRAMNNSRKNGIGTKFDFDGRGDKK